MTAAGQVRSEIVSRLKAAGLDAAEAYEDERFRERSGSVVAVGAKQAELAHAGLMNYLGERYDAESGRTVEVYGRKLKMAASLDVYAPRRKGARGCEQTAEAVSEALLDGLFYARRRYEISNVGRYKFNKKLSLFPRIAGFTLAMPVADPLTGEIIAEAGEIVTRAKAREIADAGVIDVMLDLEGKKVRVFSNGMVDISRYVDFDPAELGIKERVRGVVLRQLCEQYQGDALKTAVRENIDVLIPKHIVADDIFASVNYLNCLACGIGGAVFIAVPGVHFQFNAHLTDGPGLDGLGEAGVTFQLQRRQAVELCPRPEALGPIHGQKLKIRVGDGLQIVFFHQLGEQGRETLQNRPIDRRRQQVVLVLRSVRGRLFGLHRRFQLFCCGRKDHPAVTGFCHAKMFEFHFLLPLSADHAGHQHQQHDAQHDVQHLGTQDGLVALDVHLGGVVGVIIKGDDSPLCKLSALGRLGVMEAVGAASSGELQQVGFAVPALDGACHSGLDLFALGHELAASRPAPPCHVEHDACTDEKDNDVEHSQFPSSINSPAGPLPRRGNIYCIILRRIFRPIRPIRNATIFAKKFVVLFLQKTLDKTEDEEARESLQNDLNSMKEWLTEYEERGKYDVSPEQIEIYRAFGDNMTVQESLIWNMDDGANQIQQYLDGAMNAQQLAGALEKTLQMQKLEGN